MFRFYYHDHSGDKDWLVDAHNVAIKVCIFSGRDDLESRESALLKTQFQVGLLYSGCPCKTLSSKLHRYAETWMGIENASRRKKLDTFL